MELGIIITLCSTAIVASLMRVLQALNKIADLITYKFDDGFAERFDAVHKYIRKNKNTDLIIDRGRVKKVVFNKGY